MNRGDAGYITLNITIDGTPLAQGDVDNIELAFGVDNHCVVKKTLATGAISWNASKEVYQAFLTQEDTFRFVVGTNKWKLRILRGENVISSKEGVITVGPSISTDILK